MMDVTAKIILIPLILAIFAGTAWGAVYGWKEAHSDFHPTQFQRVSAAIFNTALFAVLGMLAASVIAMGLTFLAAMGLLGFEVLLGGGL